MASHQPRKRLSFNQQRALTAPDQPAEIFAKQRLYFQGNPLTSVLNERSDSSAGGKRPSSRGSEILMSRAGQLVLLPCPQREQRPRSQADLFISNSCFAFRNDLNRCVHTGYRYTWFLFAPIRSPPGGCLGLVQQREQQRPGKPGRAAPSRDGEQQPQPSLPGKSHRDKRVLHGPGLRTPPSQQHGAARSPGP